MKKSSLIRLSVGTATVAILVSSLMGGASSSSATASRGGTLYILTNADKIAHLDPQRNYTGEDMAFAGAFLTRTLTQYRYSTNPNTANTIIPDAAINTGISSNGARTWAFKLRKGIKWQDGSSVTCADFKYGVARRFSRGVSGGPSYSIQYLNIPSGPYGFGSAYPGLYDRPATDAHPEFGDITEPTAAQTALFNAAVICSGSASSAAGETITFKLKQPVPDFNGATTLSEFSAVQQSKDLGSLYDTDVQSNGPYMIDTYNSDMLKLVRNPNWNESADTTRPAYPDVIQMEFNVEPEVITARLKANSGNDQNAISADGIYPTELSAVMTGAQYASRRIAGFDPYVTYKAVNTSHITSLARRQAIMAAWPREATRTLGGGAYAGSYADGVIKPAMGVDYRPTNIWGYNVTKLVTAAKPAVLARKVGNYYYCAAQVIVANRVAQGTVCTAAKAAVYSVTPHPGALGYVIPDAGSPAIAAKIMSDAGVSPGELTWDYRDSGSAISAQSAAAVKSALEAAGFQVNLNGIQDAGSYYDTILNPDTQGDLSNAGWGPDWSNASTVIPPLFTEAGGFDLSHYTDAGFQGRIAAAMVITNRSNQANRWKDLNDEVVAKALVVPGLFSATQRLQGSNVKNAYIWAPYGSYPYAQLAVQ